MIQYLIRSVYSQCPIQKNTLEKHGTQVLVGLVGSGSLGQALSLIMSQLGGQRLLVNVRSGDMQGLEHSHEMDL